MSRVFKYGLILLFTAIALSSQTIAAYKGDLKIEMPKSKGTVYELFEIISRQTGLQFVYDSNVIHNEQKASIKKGRYTLYQAIRQITGNKDLDVRVLGNHLLITYRPLTNRARQMYSRSKRYENQLLLSGTIVDKSTNRPIEAGSIHVEGTSIGSVSNSNGEFRLIIPDSLNNAYILFSHLGYNSRVMQANTLNDKPHTIALQEHIVPLQEVVLRLSNPLHLLAEMHRNKSKNYPSQPVAATTFYREGIVYKSRFVKMNEGVFKIYKPNALTESPDKVELLKMRNIFNQNANDSMMAKIKAGIDASLLLDIIKNEPDFLQAGNTEYDFLSTGITTVDNRMVNVVSFKQKPETTEPYYCGELYIDTKDYALVGAQFEINPKYVKSTADMLVEHKSKGMKVTPQRVVYNVSYKKWNEHYYINYVRGDLQFKIHKRWLGSSPLHTWFEMATCKIDTNQVMPIKKNETLPRRTIFEEVHFPYDESFWENFNIIPIEYKLSESIEKITLKIEEVLTESK